MHRIKLTNTSKIALLADLHLAIHKRENVFFPHIEKAIDYFLEECESNNIELVIIAGDVFDTKNIISTVGLVNSNTILNKIFEKYPTILITGNHDFAYSGDNNAVNIASNYKLLENVWVIDEHKKMEFEDFVLHLLPWYEDIHEHIKAIEVIKNKKNILISHFGTQGFNVHEYASSYANNASAQINKTDLSKFDSIFLGHYHGHQSDGIITYISSPFQARHGDEQSQHGFIILEDVIANKFKFIENIYTPQFVSFELTKENINKMKQLQKHYIRIFIKQKVQQELVYKLKHFLLQQNYDVKLIFDMNMPTQFSVISGWQDFVLNDVDDLIIQYLDILEDNKHLPFAKEDLLKAININMK